MLFFGARAFLPRLPMTSLKDFAHGFHQSITSASHSPNRAVAKSLSGMSAIAASGFFFRISPILLFPSATTQHPHFISQIGKGGASKYFSGSKRPDKEHMNLDPCPYMRSASFMLLLGFISTSFLFAPCYRSR